MSRDPRQHVYRIVEVWGFEDRDNPPVQVGDKILDKWKGRGEQSWTIINFTSGEQVGGWVGYYLGRKEDEWPAPPAPVEGETP